MDGWRVAVGGVVALVLIIGVAAGATASHQIRERSTITLQNKVAGSYSGEVKSQVPKCEKERSVTVYHDEGDDGLDDTDFQIGSAQTNKHGKYKVHGNQAPAGDTVIAVVEEDELSEKLLCKEDDVKIKALSG
jgi:hypothetical protein